MNNANRSHTDTSFGDDSIASLSTFASEQQQQQLPLLALTPEHNGHYASASIPTIIENLSTRSTTASDAPTTKGLYSPRLRRCSSSISATSSTHLRVGAASRHGSRRGSSSSFMRNGSGDSLRSRSLCSPNPNSKPAKDDMNNSISSGDDNNSHCSDYRYEADSDGLEYGLLISLQPKIQEILPEGHEEKSNKDRLQERVEEPEHTPLACQIQFSVDHNYSNIHPHVYAPASMLLNDSVQAVGGGGSGVQVFAGTMPTLGPVVMKHGGANDMKELLALATIAEELKARGASLNCADAARDMMRRCPAFKFIYIGPHHFRKREPSVWSNVKNVIKSWKIVPSSRYDGVSTIGTTQRNGFSNLHTCQPCQDFLSEELSSSDRSIKLCGCESNTFSIQVHGDDCHALSFVLPSCHIHPNERIMHLQGDGYCSLKSVVDQLLPLMEEHLFKFTLAQSKIGGEHAVTGNELLYSGRLCGSVMDNLMTDMIRCIRNLQALTRPEEVDVVEAVRAELFRIERDELTADDISSTVDSFVGNAIKKNFSATGRFYMLRKLGIQFRRCVREKDCKLGLRDRIHQNFPEDTLDAEPLLLTPEELSAAAHLGNLLRIGALMGDTFHGAPMKPSLLQAPRYMWLDLIRHAVAPQRNRNSASFQRIWNCGLSDAGLHNLFASENELYFFDLGPPKYHSIPGFLTKFMFSFFHTLGMQEDETGRWKCRFVQRDDGKLALTEETTKMLPEAYQAFEICLNRLIEELFDGDDDLRWLLVQYVTLQLLSDAAFCLQKWQIKGGGRSRDSNHHTDIDKWLWRALWDLYVAFDLNTQESWKRLRVTGPSGS